MVMSIWRHLSVVCLLLIVPCAANTADPAEQCGHILNGPRHRETIYVFCPSLPELSPQQARSVVIAVLDTTDRIAGDTRIFFFSDASVLNRDRWPQDQEKLIESWGDAFVGAYHTHSSLLTVRSVSDNKWRNIYLPIR